MSYQIQIKRSAQKELEVLPKRNQRRIVRAIESLIEDPRPPGVRKIVGGEDLYRLRVGDYRVLYQIQEAVLTIWAIRIGYRRDIYKHLAPHKNLCMISIAGMRFSHFGLPAG